MDTYSLIIIVGFCLLLSIHLNHITLRKMLGCCVFGLQQVKLIVQNALKLYSQDRTGLVDYALESGGKKKASPG